MASTMRYEAMAADYEARLERSAAASTARYEAAEANPSMNVAQWYAAPGIASVSDDSFYAENPELIIASRYGDEAAAGVNDDSYALNPELISASNWTPAVADGSDSSFYAQNPEVLTAQNWAAMGGTDLICGAC